MSLVDDARVHIERLVEDLSGEEDFAPFLLCRNADDEVIVTILDMPEEPGKDMVADVMASIIAMWQSNEALFSSCAWYVESETRNLDVMPSEHPDRKEMAFMIHATPDGDGMHRSPVMRIDNKVYLGPWEAPQSYARMGGRFNDAMRTGMYLGRHLPEEMREYIERHIKDNKLHEIIGPMSRAFARIRDTPGFSVN